MKTLRTIAASLLALALSGCFTVQMSMRSMDSDSVYMTRLAGANEGHYQESEGVGFLFWGIVPLGNADPSKFLRKYVGNGRRIANFRAASELSPTDFLLTFVTFGIYAPLTMRYEWDVVHVTVAKKGGGSNANTNLNTNTNTIIINPSAGVSAGSVVTPASAPAAGAAPAGMVVNPVITSLTASPPSIRVGQRLAVSAEAYTAAGRPLTYSWSSTGGVLSANSGRLIFWTAPDQAGNYAILVSITDGAGGQAVGSVNVVVTP